MAPKRDRATYMRKYRRLKARQNNLEIHHTLVYHRALIGRLQTCLASILYRLGAVEKEARRANAPSSSSPSPTTSGNSNSRVADALAAAWSARDNGQ